MIRVVIALCALLTLACGQGSVPRTLNFQQEANIFCDICHTGLSMVQKQLVVLESITKNDLGSIVNKLCQAAPTDIPIVNALCIVLKDNLVDALVTLVNGVKEQTKPELLCGYFQICGKNTGQ